MKWSELRNEMNATLNEVNSSNDYIKNYLSAPVQDRISQLNEKFVAYLYGDLIEKEMDKDIESFLGKGYFNANEYAKACITTAFRCKDVYGLKIIGWTDSALKCFDNFLLALIQEKLKETIISTSDKGVERQKYQHLIKKGGDYYDIGIGLDVIYQQRNEFTHVEVIDSSNGMRKQVPVSNRNFKIKKAIILENFKKSLLALEKLIS